MKRLLKIGALLAILLVGVGLFAQDRTAPGSIEGRVMGYAGTEPLPSAPLRLFKGAAPANQRSSTAPAYTTQTRGDGAFTFKDVIPGDYTLTAGDGFVQMGKQRDAIAAKISVKPGEQIRSIHLRIVPMFSVSGRVLDASDAPEPHAAVELYEMVYSVSGERYLGQPRGRATVDALGGYSISGVEAGEYYLAAIPSAERTGIATTFFPGSANPEDAMPIRVQEGGVLRNINILMVHGTLHSIRLRVPRPASVPNDDLAYFMISTESRGVFQTELMSTGGPGAGTSTFRNLGNDIYLSPPLPPDAYIIDVTWVPPGNGFSAAAPLLPTWPSPKARIQAAVGGDDVEAGTVTKWSERIELKGTLRNRNADTHTKFSKPPFSLGLADPIGGSIGIPVNTDGAFNEQIVPGRYFIKSLLPSDLYIERATLGGLDVLNHVFTAGVDTGDPLEISIVSGAGKVDGILRDSKGQLVSFGRVVLVPSLEHRGNPNLFFPASSDQSGAFSIAGIPPGDYSILAWDWVRLYSWLNADFLRTVEARARKISIAPGAHTQIDPVANIGTR